MVCVITVYLQMVKTDGLCDKIYKLKSIAIQRMVTKLKTERNSLAVFCIPESDKEVEPIDKLVDESRLRLYENVIFISSTVSKGRDM